MHLKSISSLQIKGLETTRSGTKLSRIRFSGLSWGQSFSAWVAHTPPPTQNMGEQHPPEFVGQRNEELPTRDLHCDGYIFNWLI